MYFKRSIFILSLVLITSCAIRPLKSEYSFIDESLETVNLDNLGNGKVLIFNAVDPLRQLEERGSLNVWINEKPLGHLKEREYVIINLKKAKYEFKLLHVNVVNVKNIYDIDIDETTKVIRLEPTSLAHRINVVNELPVDFNKFKYASKRSKK